MKQRILSYMEYIDTLLYEDREKLSLDYEQLMADHMVQLGFFMHERLVHLIVTVLFALMAIGTFFVMVIVTRPMLLLLFFLLMVLLIPYIMHYYLLENSCQYMYREYDEMLIRSCRIEDRETWKEKEFTYDHVQKRSFR